MNLRSIISILVLIIILLTAIVFLSKDNRFQKNVILTPAIQPTSTNNGWKTYNFPEIKLTFKAPKEVNVRFENADDGGRPFRYNLYIEKGSMKENNYYQLYGVYRTNNDSAFTEKDLDNLKQELEPATIKEATIDGYKAVEGQIKGERNRFVTHILVNNELFSLFTSQPTPENKALTDQILFTFNFNS